MNLDPDIWNKVFIAGGAAVGAFLGQQVSMVRLRKLVDDAMRKNQAPVLLKVGAMENEQLTHKARLDKIEAYLQWSVPGTVLPANVPPTVKK